MSEHEEQALLFDWAAFAERWIPELELLHAIPMGGHRNKAVAAKLKAEGAKKGIPDIFLPVARQNWHGLYIELKYKRNTPTPEQRWWLDKLTEQGYLATACWSFEEAKTTILEYLGYDHDPTIMKY